MPSDPLILAGSPKETIPHRRIHSYQIQPTIIGRGAYSTVYLAQDTKTGDFVAAKSMDLRRFTREFESEVSIMMSRNNHHGLIGYRGSEILDGVGFIYMDYISSPTLFDYVGSSGKLSEAESLKIFWNLIEAVDSLHQQGVAHKDLKPENLFIDPKTGQIKLIDFGLSVVVSDGELVDQYGGSPMYMAPEVLNRDPHDPRLSDIWSLGVILYQMLVGDSPWGEAQSLDDLLDLVIFEPQVRLPSFLSATSKSLLNGMLSYDPARRPTVFQIKQQIVELLVA